jgi:hypothetical protein
MKDLLQEIRAKAPTVPFVMETATATKEEVDEASKTFQLINLLVIHSSPVQDQHMYMNLKRPDQSRGFYGKPPLGLADPDGSRQEGLVDLLMAVLVDPLKEMLMNEPASKKKVIVFCKDKETLSCIDEVFRKCVSCQITKN